VCTRVLCSALRACRCQPSCQAAWKWQVEPMINGVSHTSLTLLVECRRAVIPVATLSETTSVNTCYRGYESGQNYFLLKSISRANFASNRLYSLLEHMCSKLPIGKHIGPQHRSGQGVFPRSVYSSRRAITRFIQSFSHHTHPAH